ncbi:MAG: hypothetical protein OCD76_06180 [Reichenbachiella sp.]
MSIKLLALSIGIFLIAFHANAQDSLAIENSLTPILNGHKCQSFQDMRSPFIRTNFAINFGIGETNEFTVDGIPVGDSTLIKWDNELLFLGFGLTYNQKVKDWAAFYLRFDYAARTGTGVTSILTQGINTITSVESGVKFLVSKSKYHQLSAFVSMTNINAQVVDVTQYVKDLIDGDQTTQVTKKVPSLLTGGGVVLAIAPVSLIGFNLDTKIVYGETLVRGASELQYFIAGNIDFDLEQLIKIPLSVIIGATSNTIVNALSIQGNHTSTYNLKFAYSGSDAFLIGIELYQGVTPINNTTRHIGVTGFSFNCNMFF